MPFMKIQPWGENKGDAAHYESDCGERELIEWDHADKSVAKIRGEILRNRKMESWTDYEPSYADVSF